MPAAVYLGDGEMAVRELAVPPLGPHEALVEVSHCGICGTDLHLVLERYARPDSVLGHEWAGTMVFVGTGHDMPRINHNRAIVLELTIIAAYNYDIEGFAPALELLASGKLPLDQLIEADDVLLDDLLGTMHRLAAGELPGKVMVRPEVRA